MRLVHFLEYKWKITTLLRVSGIPFTFHIYFYVSYLFVYLKYMPSIKIIPESQRLSETLCTMDNGVNNCCNQSRLPHNVSTTCVSFLIFFLPHYGAESQNPIAYDLCNFKNVTNHQCNLLWNCRNNRLAMIKMV